MIVVTTNKDESTNIAISGFSFGTVKWSDDLSTPTQASMVNLGNEKSNHSPLNINFALNYQGLGLPTYLW
jgi:hypothetical protein